MVSKIIVVFLSQDACVHDDLKERVCMAREFVIIVRVRAHVYGETALRAPLNKASG